MGNKAKGSGMVVGKRNASLSPLKPRISSNLSRRCRILQPESPSESDIAAGDTRERYRSNKTRSAASAPEQSTKAPKSSVSPAGRGARSKTACLGRRVDASLPTHRTELADASDASKVATMAPKPVGSPAGRVVRSKTTHLVRTDHQGNPNEVQGEAPGAEFQLESEESNNDRSNQGKEAKGAQDNIRTRSTKGPTTRAPSTMRPRQAPQSARTRQAPPPTTTRQRPPPSRPKPTMRAPMETRPRQAPQGARTRRALPSTTTRQWPPPQGACA